MTKSPQFKSYPKKELEHINIKAEKTKKKSRLFTYNNKIRSLEGCFVGCLNLETIYSDMFRGLNKLESLYETFKNTGLTHFINKGVGLFSSLANNSVSLNCSSMFQDCNSLVLYKGDLLKDGIDILKSSSIDVTLFIARYNYTSAETSYIDSIWDYSNFTKSSPPFAYAGNSSLTIENYNSIPSGWK